MTDEIGGTAFHPDFIVIGPEKCGTSWLDAALRSILPHSLPRILKESFYFDRNFHLGPDWYSSLFVGQPELRGEVAPSYFASPPALERLSTMGPDCKLVIILRDPYVRMASHVLHAARRGMFSWRHGLERIPAEVWSEARASSRYAEIGERWLTAFGRERVLFLCYDDIRACPASFLNEFLRHINTKERIDQCLANKISKTIVYPAAVPRFVLLRRMIYLLNRRLEGIGLAALVAKIRRSALRSLFEKSTADLGPLRQAIMQHIEQHEDFTKSVDFSETVLGRDLGHWRRPGRSPSQSIQPRAVQCI